MEGAVVLPTQVATEPMDDNRGVKGGDGHGGEVEKMLGKETARFRGPPFVPKTGSKHLTIS